MLKLVPINEPVPDNRTYVPFACVLRGREAFRGSLGVSDDPDAIECGSGIPLSLKRCKKHYQIPGEIKPFIAAALVGHSPRKALRVVVD